MGEEGNGGGVSGTLRLTLPLWEAETSPAAEEGTGRREVLVTVIAPGVSKNGNHYPPGVVKSMVPLLEGAQAFVDHSAAGSVGSLRSVRDLAGYYTRPFVDERTGKLKATLRLLEGNHLDWLWSLIKETIATKRPLAGLSIEALGDATPRMIGGKTVQEVERVNRLLSCDVISRPSAGGALERLLAEADARSELGGLQAGTMGGTDGMATWDEWTPLPTVGGDGSAPPVGEITRNSAGDSQIVPTPAPGLQQVVGNSRPRDGYGRAIGGAGLEGTTGLLQPQDGVGQPIAGGHFWSGRVVLGEGQQGQGGRAVGDEQGQGQTAGAGAGGGTAVAEGQRISGAEAVRDGFRESRMANVEIRGTHEVGGATRLMEQVQAERAAMQQELREARRLVECEKTLERTLRGTDLLPEPIKARLRKRFEGRIFEGDELEGAIADERLMLAELTQVGLIRGMGYEKSVQVTMTEQERLQTAFDDLFDIRESETRVPRLSGLREAYIVCTGDTQLSGNTSPEKMRAVLQEADVTTSSFSYLLGTSMNKRLLKDYQAWPAEWQKFATITPIKDFKLQNRIRLGAFGDLSTVAEDTPYTYLTLADTQATYTPTKRGNLVAVTRETIVNDDLYSIKQIPGKLAAAAAFTLADFVYTTLLNPNGGNIYDSHPLFDSVNHLNSVVTSGNLGTHNSGSALTSAAMQTGVIAMRKQQNAASKPIGLKPRFLAVVPDLEFTAMQVTKSAGIPGSNNNDINPMLGYAEVIVSPQLNSLATSVTFWMLIADPRVVDTLEIGFVGGQVNPALFIQDQPLFGNNFSNDVITYKVRHEYGGAVVDYRGFYLGNN